MPAAGWLLVAALVLFLVAAWCGGAQAALAKVGTDGVALYASLLTFVRVCAEAGSAVLVTLALAHWLRGGWQVFLPAAAVLLVARYVLVGVGPRAVGKERAERVSASVTRLLRPLVQGLGPLLRLLASVTESLPRGGHMAEGEWGNRSRASST
jgi:Mg2+/Co2+ transporter CorB